jgi:hypothetical protein
LGATYSAAHPDRFFIARREEIPHMKRAATTMIVLMIALVASVALTAPASAALRSPQVPVLGGLLQAYLNSVGESINVLTAQDNTQVWAHTTSATTAFTLMSENSPNATVNSISMYNASGPVSPALYLLLPGSLIPQAFATGTFKPGGVLVVHRYDENALEIGGPLGTTYNGVDPTGFGFAISGPNGTFYTQDSRNLGGKAQALAYQGTGANAGAWWLCFEETSVAAGSNQTFDDCVIMMESVNPTPVSTTTWGAVKKRFR